MEIQTNRCGRTYKNETLLHVEGEWNRTSMKGRSLPVNPSSKEMVEKINSSIRGEILGCLLLRQYCMKKLMNALKTIKNGFSHMTYFR